jgi:hypothetical protein
MAAGPAVFAQAGDLNGCFHAWQSRQRRRGVSSRRGAVFSLPGRGDIGGLIPFRRDGEIAGQSDTRARRPVELATVGFGTAQPRLRIGGTFADTSPR